MPVVAPERGVAAFDGFALDADASDFHAHAVGKLGLEHDAGYAIDAGAEGEAIVAVTEFLERSVGIRRRLCIRHAFIGAQEISLPDRGLSTGAGHELVYGKAEGNIVALNQLFDPDSEFIDDLELDGRDSPVELYTGDDRLCQLGHRPWPDNGFQSISDRCP